MFARRIPLALLAAVLAGPGLALASKPADLPLDLTGKCNNDCREQPQGRTSFYPGEQDGTTSYCPCLDAFSPSLLGMLSHLGSYLGQAGDDDDGACDPHWLAEVRHLYLIAQQCQRNGDHAMAKNCLRQIGLICPRSSYARLARHELAQLERAEGNPYSEVILLVKRTVHGPLMVQVEDEPPAQGPDDWWQQRLLKAARDIQQCRFLNNTSAEEHSRPPLSPEEEQILRSTVPLEIHLDDLAEPVPTQNPLARWLLSAMEIDVQPSGIRAALSIGGRLYRFELEW